MNLLSFLCLAVETACATLALIALIVCGMTAVYTAIDACRRANHD